MKNTSTEDSDQLKKIEDQNKALKRLLKSVKKKKNRLNENNHKLLKK